MANIWEKFDKEIDIEGLQADIKEAAEKGKSFKEVPYGDYEVKVEKLELIASKAGDPMVTVWFKIVDGEHEGSMIFMNQVITKGFQIHLMNEFLRSLESGVEIEFKNYSQYGQLLMDVHEAIDEKFEYALKYDQNNKGFNTFEIVEVYELE
jgi:galactokinase